MAGSQHVNDFRDHFSGHAGAYSTYRPGYPDTLFAWLAGQCARRERAWDCATGNGQAARGLRPYFRRVVATDASRQQIAEAPPGDGIEYRCAAAESSGLAAGSVDLVTVAQALHWFDIERFYSEADRVLAPSGVIAVWSYEKCRVCPAVDAVLDAVYAAVESYWPDERRIVSNRYADIVLPWPALPGPEFEMSVSWDVQQMLGYLQTWSASKRYEADRGTSPALGYAKALAGVWGNAARQVSWPLTLKVARK